MHPRNKAKLVEARLVNAVIDAMKKHADDEDIQRQGNEIMGQLQEQEEGGNSRPHGKKKTREAEDTAPPAGGSSKRQRSSEP